MLGLHKHRTPVLYPCLLRICLVLSSFFWQCRQMHLKSLLKLVIVRVNQQHQLILSHISNSSKFCLYNYPHPLWKSSYLIAEVQDFCARRNFGNQFVPTFIQVYLHSCLGMFCMSQVLWNICTVFLQFWHDEYFVILHSWEQTVILFR